MNSHLGRFLLSIELWATVIIMVVASFVLGCGDAGVGFANLANLINNCAPIGWAYIIHRLHRHHELLKTIKYGEGDDVNSTDEKS